MCKESKEPFIAVTNRALSRHPYLEQIERIAKRKPKAILLREKDLSEEEFLACPQFHAFFAEMEEVRM